MNNNEWRPGRQTLKGNFPKENSTQPPTTLIGKEPGIIEEFWEYWNYEHVLETLEINSNYLNLIN